MSTSDVGDAPSQHGPRDKSVSRLVHRLLVTFSVRLDPDRDRIRAGTLAVIVGVAFALLGWIRHFSATDFLAGSPIDFDLSLRALARGWFESDRTIPVTIVDIDDATYRGWGSPPVTPRDKLERMLEVVTRAQPAAVVVDIDLSWGEVAGGAIDEGQRTLRNFLQRYAGPAPLVFPKRIEPAVDGTHRLAASPLDDVFTGNSQLAWAHASFVTGSGGAVRSWQDWLQICSQAGAEWLPSVVTRLSAMLATLPPGLERPETPTAGHRTCGGSGESTAKSRRLLIGPRLTGEGRHAPRSDAQAISASLLLDSQMARDDAQLFGGRVVFIGATHASAGDFWLTPTGVLPGVELLANTVRFAPLQGETQGWVARLAHRGIALLLFAIFAFTQWRLSGMAALAVSTASVMVLVAVALGNFGDLGVFDAIEAAILLMIVYKALETVFEFIAEFRVKRSHFQSGWRGAFQTLLAMCLHDHPPHPEGG